MSEIENPELFELTINWDIPDDVPGGYATNMVVQHTEHEFMVSFFEMEKPIILGTPEERRERLKSMESVRAKCVAKVTIAAGRMQEFIDALAGNYELYTSRISSEKEEVSE